MRRADPIEHARLYDPAIWKSTGQAFQRVFDQASTSLRGFPGMSNSTKVKPYNSSGYVTSYPQAGYWDGYRNVTPADQLRPQDLRKMKYKDPSGFFDLIRKGKNQTTYSNFTYLGAKANDRKFYWTTKTAAALY
ncbi:hypothetical protein CYMTET_15315 [Cymbomonas tetramitiformis]|uniref:Uncharacterized protein n=1 Tax=Cymbomonas tetramitiformis TaxID=36881 RepID=A0AAE0GE99_9CHLO|nr:hypothetical protein CYMTET_15315 [Cymbomonas tetramitiformis]